MQPDRPEPSTTPSSKLVVPPDICAWVAPADLILWIQEEVKSLAQSEARGGAGGIAAEPMLPVLAFAYARGTFNHEEIADLCNSDPLFKKIAGGPVSPSELQSLRHKDRPFLVKLLRQILIRAARQKLKLAGELPSGLQRRLHDEAVERLDNARHIDRGEDA